MIRVGWQSSTQERPAQIWRVLDLSGMTKSVRESRNYTKAGFVWLDGRCIRSLKDTVDLGRIFTLELRFPNGVVKSKEIMLIPYTRPIPQRSNSPRQLYYKG